MLTSDGTARIPIQYVLRFLLEILPVSFAKETVCAYSGEYGHRYAPPRAVQRFHPSADPSSWIAPLMRDIAWMRSKAPGLPDFPTDLTPGKIRVWLEAAKSMLGVVGISGYVKTSNKAEQARRGRKPGSCMPAARKTCVAKFTLTPYRELVRLNRTPFTHHPDYIRALKCVSTLEGRMSNWEDGWVTAKALAIAKTGLVSALADKFVDELSLTWDQFVKDFPSTFAFLVCCCSVFSERKAFTLESQKQGSLNTYMLQLLEDALKKEKEAIRVIALIHPTWEVYQDLDVESSRTLYSSSMCCLQEMAPFLERQWKRGVDKCVRRMCRMAPRGSGINSGGWNAVADAWMNLRRFQTASAAAAGLKNTPLILKVMQLIADDQFRMGGGKIHSDAHVFKDMTAWSPDSLPVLPWHAVLHPEGFNTCDALTTLLESCRKHEVSVDSWIGLAKQRVGEVSHPVDMICGVAVPNMSPECATFLKEAGLFGAGPWTGT